MEIADILIWGGFSIIVARFLIPRLLDFLGLEVTRRPKKDKPKD
ncbi:hypothetical protein AB8880_07860 [Alphaproteobacteria bacterium LSUCC0684]